MLTSLGKSGPTQVAEASKGLAVSPSPPRPPAVALTMTFRFNSPGLAQ